MYRLNNEPYFKVSFKGSLSHGANLIGFRYHKSPVFLIGRESWLVTVKVLSSPPCWDHSLFFSELPVSLTEKKSLKSPFCKRNFSKKTDLLKGDTFRKGLGCGDHSASALFSWSVECIKPQFTLWPIVTDTVSSRKESEPEESSPGRLVKAQKYELERVTVGFCSSSDSERLLDEVFVISGIIKTKTFFTYWDLHYSGYHKNRITKSNCVTIHPCFEENNDKHSIPWNTFWPRSWK